MKRRDELLVSLGSQCYTTWHYLQRKELTLVIYYLFYALVFVKFLTAFYSAAPTDSASLYIKEKEDEYQLERRKTELETEWLRSHIVENLEII